MVELIEGSSPPYYIDSQLYHPQGDLEDYMHTVVIPSQDRMRPVVVNHCKAFTPETFSAYYGIAIEDVGPAVRSICINLAEDTKNKALYRYGTMNLTILMHTWQAVQSLDDDIKPEIPVFSYLNNLQNFLSYCANQGVPLTGHDMTDIVQVIGNTVETYSSAKYKTTYPGYALSTVYVDHQPQWVYLGRTNGGKDEVADSSVLDIARTYAKDPTIVRSVSYQRQNNTSEKVLFHDTTCIAAQKIIESGAILSAEELKKRNHEINSGEFIVNQVSSSAKEHVFATSNGIGSEVAQKTFFGDEVVTFIIQENAQEQTMREYLQQYSSKSPEQIQNAIDRYLRRLPRFMPLSIAEILAAKGSARIMVKEYLRQMKKSDNKLHGQDYESFLGPEVPIGNIPAIAVPYDYVYQYEQLVQSMELPIQVLVRESCQLINDRPDLFF